MKFDYDFATYPAIDGEEEHSEWSISGSMFSTEMLDEIDDEGLNKFAAPVWNYKVLFEDGLWIAIGNHALREFCATYFPRIMADPESDQFFGSAETEEDAQAFVNVLNDPELVVDMFRAMSRNGYRITIEGTAYDLNEAIYWDGICNCDACH